ncbi:hypothetical protein RJ641_011204 [Dillenia turbinata]|uniref:TSL-kinase interacting protein 1 n=1 Tax=Dillenia turbinata TaxID=194707 RepID=A0AAN8UVQ2_9MAGN
MKAPRKTKQKEAKALKNPNGRGNGVQKPRQGNCGQAWKVVGKCELVNEPHVKSLSLYMPKALCQPLQETNSCFPETKNEFPKLKPEPRQMLDPSAKIKLQLFPLDDCTGNGLEKDGHHPYLELTLRARKKVSSVLKHINLKWGTSSVAAGEPVLFPFDIAPENVAHCRRWTLADCGITAGDVYVTVGAPPVFRLRYGWFSNLEWEGSCVHARVSPSLGCQQSEVQTGSASEVTCAEREQVDVSSEVHKMLTPVKVANAVVDHQMSTGLQDDKVGNDSGDLSQLSLYWTDSLTNISIGGLLSEASLQGKLKPLDPKSVGKSSDFQKALVVSDSLTNISIGGLLSEASLQGKFKPVDPSLVGKSSALQESPIVSDSLTNISTGGQLSGASLQANFSNPKSVGNSSGSKENQALSTNRSFKGLLFEESQQGKLNPLDLKSIGNSLGLQESQVICDSSTNISIEGLLSEASMRGKYKPLDPKSVRSGLGLQEMEVVSDSFDAFLATKINGPQPPRPFSLPPKSSILDAEETRHAFLIQKPSGVKAQDADSSKSFGSSVANKIHSENELAEDHAYQELNTDLSLGSRFHNDESSLGLAGIKWTTDSLGPFDLGISSRHMLSGRQF